MSDVVPTFVWMGTVLLIIVGATIYTFQQTGTSDLCKDNQVWLKMNEEENLYYCSSENVYHYCSKLSATKRTCYLMELIKTYNFEGKLFQEGVPEKDVIDIGNAKLIKGIISHTGEGYLSYNNKRYSYSDAVKFSLRDDGRFEIDTIDGLNCDFLWDNPSNLLVSSKMIDFRQGKFTDVKCNQNYKQIGDILTFDNGWIIDIDPSITHTTSTDWSGTFNQTKTDGGNVTLSNTPDFNYTGTTYSISTQFGTNRARGLFWNGSDWFVVHNQGSVYKYNSAWTYSNTYYNLTSQATNLQDLVWDGTFWWVLSNDASAQAVFKYYPNWTYTGTTTSLTSKFTVVLGMTYNGSDYFVGGAYTGITGQIAQYNSAWTFVTSYNITGTITTNADGLSWDSKDKYFWVIGTGPKAFQYYRNWTYAKYNYSIASEGNNPTGIYLLDDYFYVCDSANSQIDKYYSNYTYFSSGTYTSQVVNAGASVQWDNLNWTNTLGSYYNVSGGFDTLGAGSGSALGIAFDARDNSFWVSDSVSKFVYHFNSAGVNQTDGFSTSAVGTNKFGITIDTRDNSFWVSDNTTIFVYHLNSAGVNQTGGFSVVTAGISTPRGILFDARDNSFWLGDNTDRFIYHFDSFGVNISGGFSSFIGGTKGTNPSGIAFDARDNSFWVSDNTDRFIYHFDSFGVNISGGFDTLGADANALRGIAFDTRDNSLWITDTTDDFIYHFSQPLIKFQVKSCALSTCADGTFVGPANTTTTYFNSNATLNTTLTPNNQYFQYKSYFSTSNNSLTPYLESVDIGYTASDTSPTFFGSSFLPTTAYSNNTLNASIGCQDVENGTNMLMNLSWWKGNQVNLSFSGYFANGSYNSWYLMPQNITRGETWSANISCFDGVNSPVNTQIGTRNISNLAPWFSPALASQTSSSGGETNYSVSCIDIDNNNSITYSNNYTQTSKGYYSLLGSSTGIFQFRPSYYEYLNTPFNILVECLDDWKLSSGNKTFQLSVTGCTGAGAGGNVTKRGRCYTTKMGGEIL